VLVLERKHSLGGVQKIYRFENGYGANVVCTPFSYGGPEGLWELAVIKFKDSSATNFELTYNTPITNDVIGYLTWEKVEEILKQIEALPEAAGSDVILGR